MKYQEKILAIELRKHGKSYKDILKKIAASKSTLSVWLRDVELNEKQKYKLYVTKAKLARYKASKVRQQKRIDSTRTIIESAKQEAKMRACDSFFVAGVMLYWAEGGKSLDAEYVKFTNSNPSMIHLMMLWFRTYCELPEYKYKAEVHIHELHCRKKIEKYWSEITNIPLNQFHKTQIKKTSLGHRKNKLYSGTFSIKIGSRSLFRRIRGWQFGLTEHLINAPVVKWI